jgi:hypothetical protein
MTMQAGWAKFYASVSLQDIGDDDGWAFSERTGDVPASERMADL